MGSQSESPSVDNQADGRAMPVIANLGLLAAGLLLGLAAWLRLEPDSPVTMRDTQSELTTSIAASGLLSERHLPAATLLILTDSEELARETWSRYAELHARREHLGPPGLTFNVVVAASPEQTLQAIESLVHNGGIRPGNTPSAILLIDLRAPVSAVAPD
jgi:hypothetical protein